MAAFFLYMVAFMDTTATIPTGAMAERWKWKAFVGWGLFCGAIYYPLFGAWTWGGGWLSQLGNSVELGFGYVDFAGSGVVHAVGGVAALAGAHRARSPHRQVRQRTASRAPCRGHNIPMAMLGTFILLFGWFGFNAASTFAATDVRFAVAALEHRASRPRSARPSAMFYVMKRIGKPDPGMMCNGMLAGLVAITAPCAFVAALGGGGHRHHRRRSSSIEACWFIEKRGIDDPVGAISRARRRRHVRRALHRHLLLR